MDPTDMSQLASQLDDKAKTELRTFLTQETQRAQIQQQTHELTKLCWKSCVTGSVRSGKLEKNEETCLASCVERFLDVNHLTIKHLEKMRH